MEIIQSDKQLKYQLSRAEQKKSNDFTTISVRRKTVDSLRFQAKEEQRSVSSMIEFIVSKYLKAKGILKSDSLIRKTEDFEIHIPEKKEVKEPEVFKSRFEPSED